MDTQQKPLIPRYTNYNDLLCLKKARVIYDLTYYFCERYVPKSSRTNDQMIQAARSGKQNIIEGCMDWATSTASGLMLINVARGSLHELAEDYRDYIRVHGEKPWEVTSPEFKAAQKLGREHTDSDYFIELATTRKDTTVANIIIVLISQADYLIYRLIESLSAKFTNEGGYKERMYNARVKNRK